jgi:hypothetical protein
MKEVHSIMNPLHLHFEKKQWKDNILTTLGNLYVGKKCQKEINLPTARLGPACKQGTCASRVCHMKVKTTCVTSTVFSCGKLWPGFDVATCSLRQC